MDRRVYNSNGEYPGIPIPIEEKQKRLYHYTTLESFLKIWVTKKLLFSNSSRMNDILESNKSLSVSLGSKDIWQEYHDAVYSYKQISLTMDYDSYIRGSMSRMMWGHYGQKGDGVCIELDPYRINFDNTIAKAVSYSNTALSLPVLPSNIRDKEDIEKYLLDNKDLFFFIKTEDWSGENEFRIVSNTLESLDISNAITNVYVTSCWSLTCQCVEEIVKDVPVLFFHHNQTKDWLVPIVSSTVAYRGSFMKPSKEKKSIVFQNGQLESQ